MKIKKLVHSMTKKYLKWTLKSFTELTRKTEPEMRDSILDNLEDISESREIEKRLVSPEVDKLHQFKRKIYAEWLLEFFLKQPKSLVEELEVGELFKEYMAEKLDEVNNSELASLLSEDELEIYQIILAGAFSGECSEGILESIEDYFGIDRAQRRRYALLFEHIDPPSNLTTNYIDDTLKYLAKAGILFHCNRFGKNDKTIHVLPEEFEQGVKAVIGIDLDEKSRKMFLERFTRKDLKGLLESKDIVRSGAKEELIDRLNGLSIPMSVLLQNLTSKQLSELSKKVGTASYGSKEEKINRLINFIDDLPLEKRSESEDFKEVCFDFYGEIAHRNYDTLETAGIFERDREIARLFEQGTEYIFETIFSHEHVPGPNKFTPDGVLQPETQGDYWLWDAKSGEGAYDLKNNEEQFEDYLNETEQRVNVLMIIAPKFTADSITRAKALAVNSKDDSDVALIPAEELKTFALEWDSAEHENPLPLGVFNATGKVDAEKMNNRLQYV